MKLTPYTKQLLAIRRERRDMTKAGYMFVGERGGELWKLHRGCLIGHEIVDVKISVNGIDLWVKTNER